MPNQQPNKTLHVAFVEAEIFELTVATKIDSVTIHGLLHAERRHVASDDEPVTFKGTRGRTRPTRVILLPVLHRSHHGPVHHIYRWLSDTLMCSQVLQATQHIVELIPRCTGARTHDEAERDHGQGPPEPTQEQIARVAEGHHRRRSQAQAPTQPLRLLNGQHVCRPGHTP